jgi:hypothetical protein
MTLNDPTPEQTLASAYLDDQVTAAERARVEATPDLGALVASMRGVKSLVAAVPAATDTVREAAIAAALAEFDGSSNVVSLADRRHWPTRVLTAAAAVLLVGVVGVSVLPDTAEDNKETASLDTEPKFEAQTADEAVGAAVPETAAGEIFAMDAALAIDDPQQLLELAEPAAVDVDPSNTSADGAPPAAQRAVSNNVEALDCMTGSQVFLADIYFQGMLAIAVRDTVTGVTEAIDGNCTVLATATP